MDKPTPEQLIQAAKLTDFSVLAAFMLESAGITELDTSHYPDWVRCAADKVNRALYPKFYEALATNATRPNYGRGIAFGLMEAGQKGIAAWALKLPKGMPEPTEEQAEAVWRWFYREDADKATPPSNGELIATEYRDDFRELESGLNGTELADLHQGIADAARMMSGENKATETTRIYLVMVSFWRVVDQLPNSDALFNLLTTSLGPSIVGDDPKRIAQLCTRVRKKFPRRPGRPRKTTST